MSETTEQTVSEDLTSASVDSTESESRNPIASAIGKLSHAISKEKIGTGGIAELRHAFNKEVPGPVFWQLLSQCVIESGVHVSPDSERDWAIIMGGMALMEPNHHASIPLGRALAYSAYPEARLRRLLAAEPGSEIFRDTLYATVKWLDRNAQPVDWRDIAYLLVRRNDNEELTRHRRRIARSYYSVHRDD